MPFNERTRLWVPEAPAILRRRYNEVELATRFGVAGFIGWELIHAATGDVVRSSGGLHHNLIVDDGMDILGGGSGYTLAHTGLYCRVGTGSATPAVSDTALQAQVASSTFAGGFAEPAGLISGNAYHYVTSVRVFTEAEANGNLTEVGFGVSASGADTLFMRQLFVDGLGAPTTIIKTSAFQLKVVYEQRVYLPFADVTQSVTVNGVARDVTCRLGYVGSWDSYGGFNGVNPMTLWKIGGSFGAAGDSPTGPAQVGATSMASPAYVGGSFTNYQTGTWSAANANDGAGYAFLVTGMSNQGGQRDVKFDLTTGGAAAIIKTNVDKFVIAHSRSWSRH